MSQLPALTAILAAPAAATIDQVIARLAAIDAALPPTDGIACFNHLYRVVTENIRSSVAAGAFVDPEFVLQLDVDFAAFYFAALAEYDAGQETRRAWLPLFEQRGRTDLAPIQFALAGMNAHINRDLPLAIVTSYQKLGRVPAGDTPDHADYQRVNDVLARVEAELRDGYFCALLNERPLVRPENAVAMWSVRSARDAAWTNGQVLWRLRGDGALEQDYVTMLDRTFELAGRGLLIA
jgi:Family of unknown function (DUF5995)